MNVMEKETMAAMLDGLRSAMAARGLDAYIIPNKDPHQSEYLPTHYRILPALSGFTGSAGVLVVTATDAQLWTDGRYFLQAEQELSNFRLMPLTIPYAPEYIGWLGNHLSHGARVGLDGELFSVKSWQHLYHQLQGANLVVVDVDLVSGVWADRPPLSHGEVFEHEGKYVGAGRAEKLAQVRASMKQQGGTAALFTALDDVAWVLNARGSDVAFNPVFLAYLLVLEDEVELFVEVGKIGADLRARWEADGIRLLAYHAIGKRLASLAPYACLLLDTAQVNQRLYGIVKNAAYPHHIARSAVQRLKAIKSACELGHLRQAMAKEGVAWLRLERWLEATLAQGGRPTEREVAARMAAFRAEQPLYMGESFPAIVGYNANGAVIHYNPAQVSESATVEAWGLLLVDSGGHYLQGTTDCTRTFALGGRADERLRRDYTLVLKGNIALARAVFVKGTHGAQLDALARQALWAEGLDYGHGTGHGVGYFLNVHEGPHGIRHEAHSSGVALEVGMVVTNEPGIYRAGQHGVRLETMMVVEEKTTTAFGTFYGFETLTLYPFDRRLIAVEQLTEPEKAWLNAYHSEVGARLCPLLTAEEAAWLAERTAPIGEG